MKLLISRTEMKNDEEIKLNKINQKQQKKEVRSDLLSLFYYLNIFKTTILDFKFRETTFCFI